MEVKKLKNVNENEKKHERLHVVNLCRECKCALLQGSFKNDVHIGSKKYLIY